MDVGTFELGDVVIRASEQIEPATGQMRIESDPLPRIVDGIPLRLQALALRLDGGEFELDPDGCESPTITGTLTSTQGGSVAVSADPLGPPSQCSSPRAKKPPVSPADEESGVTPRTVTVTLAGTRIATTRHGEATVELACKGTSTCHGKLTLTVRTKTTKTTKATNKDKKTKKRRSKKKTTTIETTTITIATSTFAIPPGKTTSVNLQLNPVGRALLRSAHGHMSAILTLQLEPGTGQPLHTQSQTVRLVREQAVKAGRPGRRIKG